MKRKKIESLSDITSRSTIIRFVLPTIVMVLFASTYSMVDGLFISNLVGTDALASINIVTPVFTLVTALACMLSTGGVAIIGKKFGEGKYDEARSNFTTIIIVGVMIGVVATALGAFFAQPLVSLLGADGNLMGYCMEYITWVLPFATMLILQFMFMEFLIVANKPVLSMVLTLLAGFTNIALDYVFVAECGMGLSGAALATGIGATVPTVAGLLFFIFSRRSLYFRKPSRDLRMIGHCCYNGVSEMINELAVAITVFITNLSLMFYVGADGVSAITILSYAQFIGVSLMMGYSMGIASVMAFNYGEKNRKNMHFLFNESMKITMTISIIMFVILELFGHVFVGMFSGDNTSVYALAVTGLHLFSFAFLFSGINIYSSELFTSLSNGTISALIAISRGLLFLIPLLLLLPMAFGVNGIWLAAPISELLTTLLCFHLIRKHGGRYGFLNGKAGTSVTT